MNSKNERKFLYRIIRPKWCFFLMLEVIFFLYILLHYSPTIALRYQIMPTSGGWMVGESCRSIYRNKDAWKKANGWTAGASTTKHASKTAISVSLLLLTSDVVIGWSKMCWHAMAQTKACPRQPSTRASRRGSTTRYSRSSSTCWCRRMWSSRTELAFAPSPNIWMCASWSRPENRAWRRSGSDRTKENRFQQLEKGEADLEMCGNLT